MKFLMIALTALLIFGCKHQWVGQTTMPDHMIMSHGHKTIEFDQGLLIDYDYKIVNNEIQVEGVCTCKEDSGLNTWDQSEIVIYFMLLDSTGVVLDVQQTTIRTPELCRKNKFKKSFPYVQEYKGIRISWKYETQA